MTVAANNAANPLQPSPAAGIRCADIVLLRPTGLRIRQGWLRHISRDSKTVLCGKRARWKVDESMSVRQAREDNYLCLECEQRHNAKAGSAAVKPAIYSEHNSHMGCSALSDHYEKEHTNYWSEPCDTCKHRHQRPDNPMCQQCIHYA